MVRLLTASGIPTVTQAISSADVLGPNTLDPPDLGRFNSWWIGEDSTIQAPDKLYTYYSMEVNSPPLFYGVPSLQQVSKVCELLNSNFRCNVNRSTGLHVHVGDGTRGFDVKTLRCLAVILWCWEEQLAGMHPKHRRDNGYCLGLDVVAVGRTVRLTERKFSAEARKDGVEMLLNAREVIDVVEMMNTLRTRGAYSFSNLEMPFDDDLKRTVEFRMHEGTLDPKRVEMWIRVCVGLVKYARDGDEEEIVKFCRDSIGTDSQIEALLKQAGLEGPARYYAERRDQGKIEPPEEVGGAKLFFIADLEWASESLMSEYDIEALDIW